MDPGFSLMDLKLALLEVAAEVNAEPRLYTIAQAAEILNVKERTVKHHIWGVKDLRYCKIGREVRIRAEDLREFIDSRLEPCVLDKELLS